MNVIKVAILALALLFLLVTTFVDLPKSLSNIIYGIMAVFALVFLFIKRKELQIDTMFSKEDEEQNQ